MSALIHSRARHQHMPQRFGVSTFRQGALLLLLVALSIKGIADSAGAQAWEIVHLPPAVELLKHAATPTAVLAMLFFSALSCIGSERVAMTLGSATCAIVLTAYYLRSLQVGSGEVSNLAAVVILACWLTSISLRNNDTSKAEITRCIRLFLLVFTSASLALLLLGYGYPISGSTSRFFGLTPHPNTQGAYSALAFGMFLVWALAPPAEELAANGKRRVVFAFAALSFMLVVLSGSRTAMLAAAAAACLMLPWRWLARTGGASILVAAAGGGVLVAFPDSTIVDALNRMTNAPLDNRNEVLASLMDDFLAFPFLGAGDRSGVSASSYLTALSGTGIFMGAVFLLAVTTTLATASKRLLSFRFKRVPHADLVYCLLFFQISILALTEAYLFDKFGLIQITALLAMYRVERKLSMR